MRRHVSGAHSKAAQGIFSSNIPTSTISAQLYIAHAYKHRAAGSSQDTGLKFRPHRAILAMRLNAATFSAAERRPAPRRNLLPAPSIPDPTFPQPDRPAPAAARKYLSASVSERMRPGALLTAIPAVRSQFPGHVRSDTLLAAIPADPLPASQAHAAWRIACSDSCRSAPSFPGT